MRTLLLFLSMALSVPLMQAFAQSTKVSYKDGQQELEGILTRSTGEAKGGILILPAWKGIDAHSKNVAQKLSALGYTSFIADIYGKGQAPKDNAGAAKLSGFYKKNRNAYHQRINLALNQLQQTLKAKEKVVIIGYCFGGLGAIEAARTNMPVQGVVSFHGSYERDTTQAINTIKPSVLILHGADDPHASDRSIQQLRDELNEARADWQMVYYSGAVHAFTEPAAGNDNSKGAAYNEKADKRSWQDFLDFLQELR